MSAEICLLHYLLFCTETQYTASTLETRYSWYLEDCFYAWLSRLNSKAESYNPLFYDGHETFGFWVVSADKQQTQMQSSVALSGFALNDGSRFYRIPGKSLSNPPLNILYVHFSLLVFAAIWFTAVQQALCAGDYRDVFPNVRPLHHTQHLCRQVTKKITIVMLTHRFIQRHEGQSKRRHWRIGRCRS